MDIPREWTFQSAQVADAFDAHVREQLPWYDIATVAVAHLARHYILPKSVVYDLGASTGNIGKAIAPTLEARNAQLIAIDNSAEMAARYTGPGRVIVQNAEDVAYESFSVGVLFLVLQFLTPSARARVLAQLTQKVERGGALILVDKFTPSAGYFSQALSRLTMAGKLAQGASPQAIIEKELSLSGVQRPLDYAELPGVWRPFFQYADFCGYIYEG